MSRIYDDIAAEIQAVNQEISKTQGDHAALISKLGQLERERYESLRKNVPQNHVTYLSIRDGQRAVELRKAIAYLDGKLADMPNLDPHRTSVMQGDRDRYAAELARLEPPSVKPFDVEVAESRISSLSVDAGLNFEALKAAEKQLLNIGTPARVEVHPKVVEDILVEDGMTRAEAQEFIANLPEESDLAELPPPPADSGLIPPVEAQAPDSTPVDDDSIPF